MGSTRVKTFVSAVLALVLLPAAAVQASTTTLNVGPGGYATIQAAVNAAPSGSTIQVAAGTYVENVRVDGKYLTLRGNPSNPASVVIKAATGLSAPLFITNVPNAGPQRVLVEGFKITGGDSQPGQGGGVTVAINASPELRYLIVTGNKAKAYGGGISIHDNANPYIHDSVISSNYAYSGGGGIFAANNSSPIIAANQIVDNTTYGVFITNGGASGGGVYFENVSGSPALRSSPVLIGNTIKRNSAEFAGGGVMLRTGVNALIEYNTISENAAAYGGGIHAETTGSSVTIDGNTISNNKALALSKYNGSGFGGGIAVYENTAASIVRNQIQNNQSTNGGAGISAAQASVSTINGNLISGNVANDMNPNLNSEGGGIYVANATIVAINNVVTGNKADIGGAFGLLNNSVSTIAYNTIAKNVETVAAGGAIFVRNTSDGRVTSASIVNNILTQNDGYQIFEQAPKARIDNNVITTPSARPAQSGSGLYFSYNTNGLNSAAAINSSNKVSAQGNVDGNPNFVNLTTDDYRLQPGSSAINNATTVNVPSAPLDFRQAKRLSLPPDAGAFEYEVSPVIVTDPLLTGNPQVGATLTATPGFWGTAPTTTTYQWLRDGTPITGATGATYTAGLADVGKMLSVSLIATKHGSVSKQTSTPALGPIARGPFFADVAPNHTFYSAIDWMAISGISTGTANLPGAPLYLPDSSVSHQAMSAFLMRMSGETFTPPTEPTFVDVDSNHPFYTAIEWMNARGISTGTPQPSGKPRFGVSVTVTREVMALFLYRYSGAAMAPPTVQSFADVPIDRDSATAIAWMASTGISTGTAQPSGLPLYKPDDRVSRQAMAAFLYRTSLLP